MYAQTRLYRRFPPLAYSKGRLRCPYTSSKSCRLQHSKQVVFSGSLEFQLDVKGIQDDQAATDSRRPRRYYVSNRRVIQ